MASANKTLTASEFGKQLWYFTGTVGGATLTVTVPAIDDATAYLKDVIVDNLGDGAITITTGSGATVTFNAGTSSGHYKRGRIASRRRASTSSRR